MLPATQGREIGVTREGRNSASVRTFGAGRRGPGAALQELDKRLHRPGAAEHLCCGALELSRERPGPGQDGIRALLVPLRGEGLHPLLSHHDAAACRATGDHQKTDRKPGLLSGRITAANDEPTLGVEKLLCGLQAEPGVGLRVAGVDHCREWQRRSALSVAAGLGVAAGDTDTRWPVTHACHRRRSSMSHPRPSAPGRSAAPGRPWRAAAAPERPWRTAAGRRRSTSRRPARPTCLLQQGRGVHGHGHHCELLHVLGGRTMLSLLPWSRTHRSTTCQRAMSCWTRRRPQRRRRFLSDMRSLRDQGAEVRSMRGRVCPSKARQGRAGQGRAHLAAAACTGTAPWWCQSDAEPARHKHKTRVRRIYARKQEVGRRRS